MDDFTIIITGSSRPELLKVTVETFKRFLCTEKNIKWIMHEDIIYKNESEKSIEYAKNNNIDIIYSNGVGLSTGLSKLVKKIDSKYVLYLQDDWELERPIELDKLIWLMDNNDYINNIIFSQYRIPKEIAGIKLHQKCVDTVNLVELNAWYLNPGVCRSKILKKYWVNIRNNKPEQFFINKLRNNSISGIYWLGKIGDYRYIRHLGCTWRMAKWRRNGNKPGGNVIWEISSLNHRAPWLKYKKRYINRKIKIGDLDKENKKILENHPDLKDHIFNNGDKII